MRWNRTRHELRLLGIGTYLLPLAVVAIYVGFSLTVRLAALHNDAPPAYAAYQMGRGLLALLENGLPLAAGLLAAAVVSSDPAVELHLSLPTTLRSTITRRLGLLLLWIVVTTAATSGAIIVVGSWVVPVDQPLGQLTWIAPVLWYSGAGAVLALALRSRIASSAVVGMSWIAQFLFKQTFLGSQVLVRLYPFLTEQILPGISRANASLWFVAWEQNRLILLALGVGMLATAFLLLGRSEALLGAET